MRRRTAVALSLAIVAAVVVSRVREVLAPKTPARRDPAEAATRLPGIATTGEPAEDHPLAPGEEPTPGSAAVPRNAARESHGPVVGAGAGDSYARPPLGVLGPEPCNAPTGDGPCALRLGHPLGPEMPGGGHLP